MNTLFTDKVILFLTDGEPTINVNKTMETLSRLNGEQNNKYIVLTYGLGKGNIKTGEMWESEKWSCSKDLNQY